MMIGSDESENESLLERDRDSRYFSYTMDLAVFSLHSAVAPHDLGSIRPTSESSPAEFTGHLSL